MILLLIAIAFILPFTIINYFNVDEKKGYFKETAINIDKFANREFRATWNKYLRIESGYKFGNENETISSALGKNERDNTLSKTGKVICYILGKIEKDHCKKSIKEL